MQQAPGQTQQQAPGARGGGPAGGGGGEGPVFGNPYSLQDRTRLEVPDEFQALPIWTSSEAELVAMVSDSQSTVFQKAIACKRLGFIGGRDAIAPIAELLGHPQLGGYARFGMEPNPDPLVDQLFREALTRLEGPQLMEVIHSIGARRQLGFRTDDASDLEAVGRLMNDDDPEVAQAACATVGMIGGPAAAELLQGVLDNSSHPAYGVAARACLLCAERMMASERDQSLQLYSALSTDAMPRPVQLAAIRVLNEAGPAPAGAQEYPPPADQPEDSRGGRGGA